MLGFLFICTAATTNLLISSEINHDSLNEGKKTPCNNYQNKHITRIPAALPGIQTVKHHNQPKAKVGLLELDYFRALKSQHAGHVDQGHTSYIGKY